MSFLNEITRAPIPHDLARAQEARARFPGFAGAALDLIGGAAGCAPYLRFLLEREGDWLRACGDLSAAEMLDGVLAALPDGLAGDPSTGLRLAKRRVALLAALADLGGVWELSQVTGALTRLADKAVQSGLNHLFAAELARGRMPGLCLEDQGDLGGYFVLAMGKMGADELNYSSDIDLICLFDESRYPADNLAEIRTGFVRITKGMVKLLSEVTAEGYVFRTDLRLRPNPAVTPVCIGMDHAAQYYESLGRTWERAAYIKARVCAGDLAAGERFLTELRPFVWRRHLDFAAIQDAHDMRLRIREHKGIFAESALPGLDLKLAPGGIREIEFFAQTRQLICGGRDAGLRPRGTLAALAALREKGWISDQTESDLRAAYSAHRNLEHRIQMLDDAQSHAVPVQADKLDRLARLCGVADTGVFTAELEARLRLVRAHTEVFFAGAGPGAGQVGADLAEIFVRPEIVRDLVEKWETLPALRNERARVIFHRLLPEVFRRISSAADPDAAILQFDAFLSGLPAGVQLFSLFKANPQLLDLLVDICATTPRLAQYLGRNAQVFDAVIGSDFFAPFPPADILLAALQTALEAAAGYEALLDAARIWVKEAQFRAGVQLLRRVIDAEGAAAAFSAIAEVALRGLFPQVIANMTERHGPPPGRGAVVLAMGKLGSREMTATSDLDLIVVYDAGDAEKSAGPRPLYVAQYYSRLTQFLVSALTVPTSQGVVYKVDMRLRPSGQKGPAAVSLSGFAGYQLQEAWTWEHLALCRARVVAGPEGLAADVIAAAQAALAAPHDPAKVLADVREMRAKLAAVNAAAETDTWEVKLGLGRLLDVEMLLQAGLVLNYLPDCRTPVQMLDHLRGIGWISAGDAAVLALALRKMLAFQQMARLGYNGAFEPERAGKGMLNLLCSVLDAASPVGMQDELAELKRRAAGIVAARLGA